MTENTQIKLFGFRISNASAVIVFFLVLILLVDHFYEFYYFFFSISFLVEEFQQWIVQPFSLRQFMWWVTFLSPLALMLLGFYILIKCFRARKLDRKAEDIDKRWFGLKLNRISVIVLGIISIIRIVSILTSLLSQLDRLLYGPPVPPTFYSLTVVRIVGRLILVLVCTYTLLVCIRANSSLKSNI